MSGANLQGSLLCYALSTYSVYFVCSSIKECGSNANKPATVNKDSPLPELIPPARGYLSSLYNVVSRIKAMRPPSPGEGVSNKSFYGEAPPKVQNLILLSAPFWTKTVPLSYTFIENSTPFTCLLARCFLKF